MLKQIRAFYGIEQGLFADYLGISRSQLSMAEGGHRNIAATSMVQLLPLYQAIGKPAGEPDEQVLAELATQHNTLLKKIKLQISRHQHRLYLLEERLASLKASQEKSLQIISHVGKLAATATGNDASLLKIIELSARKLQRKTGQPHQWKLELKILHLQTELDYFKKQLDSL